MRLKFPIIDLSDHIIILNAAINNLLLSDSAFWFHETNTTHGGKKILLMKSTCISSEVSLMFFKTNISNLPLLKLICRRRGIYYVALFINILPYQ